MFLRPMTWIVLSGAWRSSRYLSSCDSGADPLGIGEYRDVEGHHIHAKAAFRRSRHTMPLAHLQ
jgi:hypothetical protein